MYWKSIPYAVRASDAQGQVSRQLPAEFQEAVDAAAMRDGDTEAGTYAAAFKWAPAEERAGSAAQAADAVVAEIVAAYPKERLLGMADGGS